MLVYKSKATYIIKITINIMNITKSNMRSEFDARRLEKKLKKYFLIGLSIGIILQAMYLEHLLINFN